jgi:hypothetical protein
MRKNLRTILIILFSIIGLGAIITLVILTVAGSNGGTG